MTQTQRIAIRVVNGNGERAHAGRTFEQTAPLSGLYAAREIQEALAALPLEGSLSVTYGPDSNFHDLKILVRDIATNGIIWHFGDGTKEEWTLAEVRDAINRLLWNLPKYDMLPFAPRYGADVEAA
jgi:hypothetical protein